MCVFIGRYGPVSVYACEGHEKTSDLLELKLQVIVDDFRGVLESNYGLL